ncbi:MAG: hypothetical protein ACREP9_12115, partial [Candidatus Dormibacteraceae bacterium]
FTAAMVKELGEVRLFPPSVRELISLQLDRLPPAAFAFLVAGAVLEHDAPFERLCEVADLSEKEGLVALDEVQRRRLMRESKPRTGNAGYAFTHDMIREVVSVEAGETRSRIFHRRALRALQDTAVPPVPPATLAYHALKAGEIEPAFRWSVAAGDEALVVCALHDAIEHYEQAWRLLTEQAPGRTMQGRLSVFSASDVQHLPISLGRAYKLARVWGQTRLLYGALLEQVLRVARPDDDQNGLEKTHWCQAMIDLYAAERTEAITHGERALAYARTLGQPDLLVLSLTALTDATGYVGAWEKQEQLAAEAHALSIATRDRVMEADCLCLLANTHLHRGRPHLGITQARSALTISQEIENAWGQINALYELTAGLLDSGAYTEALEMALQAVVSARSLSARTSRANAILLRSLMQVGGIYRATQAFHAAREIDLEALSLNEETRSHPFTALVTTVLCADHTLLGEWIEAYHYARQVAMVEGTNVLPSVGLPQWCVTEALLHSGDVALAQAHLAHLGTRTGDGRRDRIAYLQANAVFAQGESHPERAATSLEEARVLAEESGLPGELWHIHAALGDLYLSWGEQLLADQAFTQAAIVVQELAEKIEDEALRSSFLTAPRVRRVLEHGAQGAGRSPHDC